MDPTHFRLCRANARGSRDVWGSYYESNHRTGRGGRSVRRVVGWTLPHRAQQYKSLASARGALSRILANRFTTFDATYSIEEVTPAGAVVTRHHVDVTAATRGKCDVAGQGCKAPANAAGTVATTCFACGLFVCTSDDCSSKREWVWFEGTERRTGKQRVCQRCAQDNP